MGQVIHWVLCKKFKFDHTNEWYLNNPESVLENETIKLLWDVNPEKKENLLNCGRCCPSWPQSKIERKWKKKNNKYLDLTKELKKKLWNMKVTFIAIVIVTLRIVTKGLLPRLEDLEITVLLRTARILRRVLETWGDLLTPKFQRKPIS